MVSRQSPRHRWSAKTANFPFRRARRSRQSSVRLRRRGKRRADFQAGRGFREARGRGRTGMVQRANQRPRRPVSR